MKLPVRIESRNGLDLTPVRASAGAAAYDLRANISVATKIWPQDPPKLISTGVYLDMSACPSMCALVVPRSGLGHKHAIQLGNTVGLIDSDYQGEIMVSMFNRKERRSCDSFEIKPGDRIAQLLFLPVLLPELEVVEQFETATERGQGGFGSTGVK